MFPGNLKRNAHPQHPSALTADLEVINRFGFQMHQNAWKVKRGLLSTCFFPFLEYKGAKCRPIELHVPLKGDWHIIEEIAAKVIGSTLEKAGWLLAWYPSI
jgi:hypothetical protein